MVIALSFIYLGLVLHICISQVIEIEKNDYKKIIPILILDILAILDAAAIIYLRHQSTALRITWLVALVTSCFCLGSHTFLMLMMKEED